MKVYIAGKVSGLPWADVTMKFGAAQKALEAKGFEVANPLAIVSEQYGKLIDPGFSFLDTPWEVCMKWVLPVMFTCDAVVMLPCWPKSRGGVLERFLSGCVKIPVYEGLNDPRLSKFYVCRGA